MRPDIIVSRDQKIIGSIEQPCCPYYLCRMEINGYLGETRDESARLFNIRKCCCNCHTLFGKECGCCLGMAATMSFDVMSQSGVELHKQYNGFINECTNMADMYLANWDGLDDDGKALLMNAVHFIDLMWFENNYFACGGI